MRRLDRVPLTNDDGIDAPGLAVLEQVAAEVAREVWVVAPAHDQSGTSHSISLHAPLRAARLGDRRFAVVGTPGNCAVLAVRHLMREAPPDLVLSGVNRGANLGIETVFCRGAQEAERASHANQHRPENREAVSRAEWPAMAWPGVSAPAPSPPRVFPAFVHPPVDLAPRSPRAP